MTKVARASLEQKNVNTLRFHKVSVIIQTYPGKAQIQLPYSPLMVMPNEDDDQNLEYSVYIDGKYSQSGLLTNEGKLDMYLPSGKSAELRIFGSKYIIEPEVELPAAESVEGIQKRLIFLGYITKAIAPDSPALLEAIAEFERDHDLPITGSISTKRTINALSSNTDRTQRIIVPLSFKKLKSPTINEFDVVIERSAFNDKPLFPGVIYENDEITFNESNNQVETRSNATEIPIRAVNVALMSEGASVKFDLLRSNLDPTAVIYARVSHPDLLKIQHPIENTQTNALLLSAGESASVKIVSAKLKTVEPKTAFLELRFGAEDGPCLARLAICVLPTLVVNMQAHFLAVTDSQSATTDTLGASRTLAISDYDNVVIQTKAFWRRLGVELNFAQANELQVILKKQNTVALDELPQIMQHGFCPNSLNLYILPKLEFASETPEMTILTFSPEEYRGFYFNEQTPLPFPGMFMNAGFKQTATQRALLLSKKIAQFLGLSSSLQHAESSQPDAVSPYYANTNLMLSEQLSTDCKLSSLTIRNDYQEPFNSQCLLLRERIIRDSINSLSSRFFDKSAKE